MPHRSSTNPSLQTVAQRAPFLEREEETALALRWRDARDQQALNRLTQAHMRLVLAVAARFRNFGLSMPDLVQEGHVGLMEAAARFDPDRGVRFSTYATWWIRAAIQDYILRNWSIVRGGTSSTQKALFFNLRRLRARIAKNNPELGETEIHRRIGEAVGVTAADVATMAARISGPDSSLNAPLSSDGEAEGAARQDFLVSDSPQPDEIVEAVVDGNRRMAWLQRGLATLSDRERRILGARRLSEEAMTLEDLGQHLGISKERVRQIENRALEKLKAALLRDGPLLA